jgi:predicted aspartyl protease
MGPTGWQQRHRLLGLLLTVGSYAGMEAARSSELASQDPGDALHEIVVTALEPRFVAPTRRDQIGRIWAPVTINGKGPFRLVLDTGASGSGICASVADILGIAPDPSHPILLRGAMGSVAVSTVRVDSFEVGDVIVTPATLPILPDALGGAQGILGMEGFGDKRVFIDFGRDVITVTQSRNNRPPPGFTSIPVERSATGLLAIRAEVGGVRVHAIIDTGAQTTIGNEAMKEALVRRHAQGTHTQVTDVTSETEDAEVYLSPSIRFGAIDIHNARIIYHELPIFEHWHLSHEPALLIGMDALGLLDVLIIDYRRHELQMRTRAARN